MNGYNGLPGRRRAAFFKVALFRFRDGTPLLAMGAERLESESPRLVSLRFYKQAADGNRREVQRPEFPEKGSEHHYFELPHLGRTIVVRDDRGSHVLQRLTWDGEKFAAAQ